jgi:hypothetical protein
VNKASGWKCRCALYPTPETDFRLWAGRHDARIDTRVLRRVTAQVKSKHDMVKLCNSRELARTSRPPRTYVRNVSQLLAGRFDAGIDQANLRKSTPTVKLEQNDGAACAKGADSQGRPAMSPTFPCYGRDNSLLRSCKFPVLMQRNIAAKRPRTGEFLQHSGSNLVSSQGTIRQI